MQELHGKPEVSELAHLEISAFKEIRPETDMTVSEAKSFVNSLFKETHDASDGYYTTYHDRLKITPQNNERGKWEDGRGESKYIPSGETKEGQAAQAKLAEKGLIGIDYKNAEPDFSTCAEATVEIDHMTEHRADYIDADGTVQPGNFSQADSKCAEQWNTNQKDRKSDWTAADVREWRWENKHSWHERCDTKTMDLVSREIHSYFGHSGGCSECKTRDAVNVDRGGFDE